MNSLSLVLKALLLVNVSITSSTESSKNYYVLKVSKMNWHAAFQDCLTRGFQLATVYSSEEENKLEAAIRNADMSNQWLWISGTDQGEEGNFFWMSTGDPMTYKKFGAGQPDNAGGHENCVHIWKNGKPYFSWNDAPCTQKLYYICEDKPVVSNYSVIDICV